MNKKYCVYLTIYSGNNLPPFYIGYTTVDKIINKNYHGTVASKKYKKIWKQELVNNPHLFKTVILSTYDTMVDAKIRETKLQKYVNAAKNPLYINQHIQGETYCIDRTGMRHTTETLAKIQQTKRERGTPGPNKGRKLSKEWRENIRKASPFKGKKRSRESVEKSANSRRGMKRRTPITDEMKRKYGEGTKRVWESKTEQEKKEWGLKFTGEQNGFYGKTHTLETIEKIKNRKSTPKGTTWWTNGKESIRRKECPGEGWRKGRR